MGYASIVETMLRFGADPFLKNGAVKSALDLAREGGFNDIVMRLLSATQGGEEARADFARRRKGREGGDVDGDAIERRRGPERARRARRADAGGGNLGRRADFEE